MDEDGLIYAGEGEEQVTWMNMQAGEILPTPRQGKPVEINAYWYNALRCMEAMAGPAGKDGSSYGRLALQVRRSFAEKFWMEEKNCLKDLLSGSGADEQIRCNQIWAVSMPFTMLDPEQERQIVDVVFEKLYTPYGLRTLEEEDPQFHPVYSGVVSERNLAYHQGTYIFRSKGNVFLDNCRHDLIIMILKHHPHMLANIPKIFFYRSIHTPFNTFVWRQIII